MSAAIASRLMAQCKNVLSAGKISSAYQQALAYAQANTKQLASFQQLARARLVLGTGWSSFAFAKTLNHKHFDVHIVSPRNHMVFTPLLASTSVGTLEFRSISEPVKNAMPSIHFTKGTCTRIDTATKTLTVETPELLAKGEGAGIIKTSVPYDLLVVGVGARNNTFNIAGVEENMFYLKELSDARAIRSRITQNIEVATLGGVSAAERRRLLSFVIVGGGPTGVEFSAELHDFVVEDLLKMYPEVYPEVTITVIEGNKLLGAFDASLREYTESKFRRDKIQVRTGANVVRVEKGKVVLSDGDEIPFGLGIWNTGIGPRPLVSKDTEVFSKDKWGHIATNDCLQVVKPTSAVAPSGSATPGAPSTDVYDDMFAFGDCASVGAHKYAATAQVAEQQGTWLADHFNAAVAERSKLLLDTKATTKPAPSVLEAVTQRKAPTPFQYHHGGSLAFIGSFTAVSDFTQGSAIAPLYGARLKGWVSWFIWRSAYLTKLGSWRNRLQVPADWTRTLIFGRDTTQF